MERPVKNKCLEEDFVDVLAEGVSAKWSSLTAPLMPSLLMSRQASASLFDTPWRSQKSPVVLMRQASLYVLNTFENDLECQKSWLSFCGTSLRSCLHLTAGEVIGWSYTFVFLIATMMGASSVSSALGLGTLVYRLYLVGCVRSFLAFIYEIICLLQDGPLLHAKQLVRSKAKTFVLSVLASAVLPKDVLAAHMTACVLFGFMEKTLKCLFRLSIPSIMFLANIKDMGNAYASRLVDAVLGTLRGSSAPKPLAASCEEGGVAALDDLELRPVPKQDKSGDVDASPGEEPIRVSVESPSTETIDIVVLESSPDEGTSEKQPHKEVFAKPVVEEEEEDGRILSPSATLCKAILPETFLRMSDEALPAAAAPMPLATAVAELPPDDPVPEKQLLKIKWKTSTANHRLHRRAAMADA